MARIAIILGRLVIGGTTMDTLQAAQYLQRQHEVLLITGYGEKDEFEAAYLTGHLPRVRQERIDGFSGSLHPIKDFRALQKIRRVLRKFAPDIVHTHTAKAGLLGRLAARAEKVPVVVHTYHGFIFHSYYNKIISGLAVKAERWLASFTTCIVALSQTQKMQLTQVYHISSPHKIQVIPLGIDLSAFQQNQLEKREQFREKYLLEPHEVAIGIVGRIVPVKNHHFFIKVVSALKEAGIAGRFFIIGDGALRKKLQTECRQLGLDYTFFPEDPRKAYVTFTSWITEVEKAMAGLDIITLTSFNEGTPVSLLEAQAAGKPVVATRAGGIEDIMIPGKTGFIIEQDDKEAFANALILLIKNTDTALSMAHAGVEFATGHFQKQRQVDALNALYHQLLHP